MTAVWNTPDRRPAVVLEHPECPKIFNQSIAQSAVELEPVPIRAHPAVTDKVPSILHREQVFTRSHRARIPPAELVLEFVIERITRFFEPEKRVLSKGVS